MGGGDKVFELDGLIGKDKKEPFCRVRIRSYTRIESPRGAGVNHTIA